MVKRGVDGWVRSRIVSVVAAIVASGVFPALAIAQMVPDGTVGTQVFGACDGTGGACGITNGSTRGNNLFHSFQQFSLPNGDFAAFITDPAIQNVIVRVTGVGQPFVSNINGAIATLDPAFTTIVPTNFFLLNPNGIIFGPNARILVGGSFLATTAERMLFQDGTTFSTRVPNPLLSVSVPTGLQMGQTPGKIQSRLRIGSGINSRFTDFALVGGDITLNGSIIIAPGRRIELGGVGENSTVLLNPDGLQFPINIVRRDVSLINNSFLSVANAGGGHVTVNARNLDISSSTIEAGIAPELGTSASQAGNIILNTSGALSIFQSQIRNWVNRRAIGNGGSIFINTDSLSFTGSGFISASTFGTGNAGSVRIQSNNDVRLDSRGNIFSLVEIQAEGNAGNIEILARNLSLTRGARISTGTLGRGNAGNVNLTITDSISLDGNDPTGRPPLSGIYSSVFDGAEGRGGDIRITTGSLSITNSAKLDARVSGKGDGGNIIVNARDTIFLNGTEPSGDFLPSGIYSSVLEDAEGRGGDIRITTGSFSITNSAKLDASIFGKGNGGDIIINARDTVTLDGVTRGLDYGSAIFATVEEEGIGSAGDIRISTGSLFVLNGGAIQTRTQNQGDAGNIFIDARDSVMVDGSGINFLENRGTEGFLISNIPSEISSDVEIGAKGNAGNITINAGNNILLNPIANSVPGVIASSGKPATDIDLRRSPSGVFISSQTSGLGNAGSIVLNAGNQISLDNQAEVSANTTRRGIGNAGNVSVSAGNLVSLDNEARIFVNTNGIGNAGNVSVSAGNLVSLNNDSVVFGTVEQNATGSGGNIDVSTKVLSIANGSQLQTKTSGQGKAGNVTVDARDRITLNGSSPGGFLSAIIATTEESSSGAGGNILVRTGSLSLTNDAAITTSTNGLGNAGNISIQAAESLFITNDSLLQASTGGLGIGGGILINTNTLEVSQDGSIESNATNTGDAGNISVNANQIRLSDRSTISTSTRRSDGGDITLNVRDILLLRRGSTISTTAGTAQAGGNGGNITINAPNGFIIGVKGENSDITANAFSGSGGRVNITAQGIYGLEFRPRLTPFSDITASSTFGASGIVTLNTPNVDPSRGLTQLPQNVIETNRILANSCIMRDRASEGTFIITGTGGLPQRPGSAPLPVFTLGEVRKIAGEAEGASQTPKPELSLQEAEGIYQLPDGQLILSWECPK